MRDEYIAIEGVQKSALTSGGKYYNMKVQSQRVFITLIKYYGISRLCDFSELKYKHKHST